jgi:hypothetical protein
VLICIENDLAVPRVAVLVPKSARLYHRGSVNRMSAIHKTIPCRWWVMHCLYVIGIQTVKLQVSALLCSRHLANSADTGFCCTAATSLFTFCPRSQEGRGLTDNSLRFQKRFALNSSSLM